MSWNKSQDLVRPTFTSCNVTHLLYTELMQEIRCFQLSFKSSDHSRRCYTTYLSHPFINWWLPCKVPTACLILLKHTSTCGLEELGTEPLIIWSVDDLLYLRATVCYNMRRWRLMYGTGPHDLVMIFKLSSIKCTCICCNPITTMELCEPAVASVVLVSDDLPMRF